MRFIDQIGAEILLQSFCTPLKYITNELRSSQVGYMSLIL